MDTATIIVLLIGSLFSLVFIGLLLLLLVIGRIRSLEKGLNSIYGEEHEIKKRIEQYVAKKASDELGKLIENYREVLDEQSSEVTEVIKTASIAHLDSFEKFIKDQESLITKQTEYIVGAIVKKAQDEIGVYKANQMEGIDVAVRDIIQRVAPEILGKAIKMEDQEELVWKSLEQAKKEGIFLVGNDSLVNRGAVVKKSRTKTTAL